MYITVYTKQREITTDIIHPSPCMLAIVVAKDANTNRLKITFHSFIHPFNFFFFIEVLTLCKIGINVIYK